MHVMSAKFFNVYNSSQYRSFISERDKALEKINLNYQFRAADIQREAFAHAMSLIAFKLGPLIKVDTHEYFTHRNTQELQKQLEGIFRDASFKLSNEVYMLRRMSYLLAYVGEAEAIGRALVKEPRVEATRNRLDQATAKPHPLGGDTQKRFFFYFKKLIQKFMNTIELASFYGWDEKETLQRIYNQLPPTKDISIPRRNLKDINKYKEADQVLNRAQLIQGTVTDAEWKRMVEEYMSEYVPKNRGPDSVVAELDIETELLSEREIYQWEIEQELNHIFVDQVRDAEKDAAHESGIKNFMWVAILDDKTCEKCCEWRNGLLSSEIRAELEGEHKDDDCQAYMAPAHFNCRCRNAAITDTAPEQEQFKVGEFEQWLNKMETSD